MVSWSDCRSFFEPDGSLRDIYVPGGGLASWSALFRVAREASVVFKIDGVARPLPTSPQEAFTLRGPGSPLLSIDWHGIMMNAHFFSSTAVEVDLNPSAVDSATRFEALVAFMRRLAREAGRRVVLTPENRMEEPYLETDPTGELVRAN